jgi:predicted AAA+ superfamily ATPase
MEVQYLKRNIDEILLTWSRDKPPDRKPLLLRGARQVGKSSALRQLGKQYKHFIEINFDENKEVKSFLKALFLLRKSVNNYRYITIRP